MTDHDPSPADILNIVVPHIEDVSELLTACGIDHAATLATVLAFWGAVRPVLDARGLPYRDDDHAGILAIVRLHAATLADDLRTALANGTCGSATS
jgi:hypothetical protein